MSVSWIAAFAAVAALVLLNSTLLLGLVRRVLPVLERAEETLSHSSFDLDDGLPLMAHVPEFSVFSPAGEEVRSSEILSETTIFLFVDGACGPCRELLPLLGIVGDRVDDFQLVIIAPRQEADAVVVPPNVRLYLQDGRAASDAFQTHLTPRAFVVHPIGAVLERIVPRSIEDLRLLATHQKGGNSNSIHTTETAV